MENLVAGIAGVLFSGTFSLCRQRSAVSPLPIEPGRSSHGSYLRSSLRKVTVLHSRDWR